eukprot:Nk52_evm12s216 gene=Nk52_evmTU12s216
MNSSSEEENETTPSPSPSPSPSPPPPPPPSSGSVPLLLLLLSVSFILTLVYLNPPQEGPEPSPVDYGFVEVETGRDEGSTPLLGGFSVESVVDSIEQRLQMVRLRLRMIFDYLLVEIYKFLFNQIVVSDSSSTTKGQQKEKGQPLDRHQPRVGPHEEDTPRKKAIIKMIQHAWRGYERFAFGFDYIRPRSLQGVNDGFGGIGLTVIDGIDTIYLALGGESGEYQRARAWICGGETDTGRVYGGVKFRERFVYKLSVFETTIRVLGGLLSIHGLTGDVCFLRKAVEMGDILMCAFPGARTGRGEGESVKQVLPFTILTPRVFKDENGKEEELSEEDKGEEGVCRYFVGENPGNNLLSLAEIGSVQLEFAYLSHLTGDGRYVDAADGVMEVLQRSAPLEGMIPQWVNATHPQMYAMASGELKKKEKKGEEEEEEGGGEESVRDTDVFAIADNADSFYETVLKRWIQSGRQMPHLREFYRRFSRFIADNMQVRVQLVWDDTSYRLVGKFWGLRSPRRSGTSSSSSNASSANGQYKWWEPESVVDELRLGGLRYNVVDWEHLSCFIGGMYALGWEQLRLEEEDVFAMKYKQDENSVHEREQKGGVGGGDWGKGKYSREAFDYDDHITVAREFARTCKMMYSVSRTGLAPERIGFQKQSSAADYHRAKRFSHQSIKERYGPSSDSISNNNANKKTSEPDVELVQTRMGLKIMEPHTVLRPEAVETWFVLHRVLLEDNYMNMYRDWGWEYAMAIEQFCKVPAGYCGLGNVLYGVTPPPPTSTSSSTSSSSSPLFSSSSSSSSSTAPEPTSNNIGSDGGNKSTFSNCDDFTDSFVFAETFKYLLLLFSDASVVSLREYVFNTEGHPFPILKTPN